ncbi:unnamed protein product [Brassica oleracea]
MEINVRVNTCDLSRFFCPSPSLEDWSFQLFPFKIFL